MNEDTRKALAQICAIPAEFEKLAIIAKDELLDMQIDNLDLLMKRGKYAHLRTEMPSIYESCRIKALVEKSK